MCDVVFDIGGEMLQAHRVVLSACSPYLRACCLNPSSMSQDGLVQIKVEGYSYKICLKLIEFLYTGRLFDSPRDEFWKLCAEWQITGATAETPENDEAYSDDCMEKQVMAQKTERRVFRELVKMPLECGGTWEPETRRKAAATRAKRTLTATRISKRTKDVDGASISDGVKGRRKHQSHSDPVSSKRSRQTFTQSEAQKNSTFGDDSVTPPPLLTEEWISSCFKDDNAATENQNLYDGDTAEESMSDVQSDSDGDPEFKPGPNAVPKRKDKMQSFNVLSTGIPRLPECKVLLRAVNIKPEPRRKRIKGAKALMLSKLRSGECPVCGDMFDTPAKLYLHKATVHRNKQNGWCKICKLRFPDKNKLQVHNVTNHFQEGMTLPNVFTCQEESCTYKTYCRKSMFSHKKIVHQAERSICDLCGKSLKSEASLKQHHKHMHDDTFNKDHPCQQCEKIFKSYAGLSRHMMSIHTESGQREKHICPNCGYAAYTRSTMTEHLFKQHDILPPKGKPSYKCKHCTFKTTKIRDIKNHELRHEPEKRFRCDQCPRCYPTQREVNRHRRLKHTKNKQEIRLMHCDQCDYTTKYGKAALRSHISVKHDDNRPWICSICAYRTKLKGNLHKHIRNVHKCEVKTNWTLTKVAQDGQCSLSYNNPTGHVSATLHGSDFDTDEEEMKAAHELDETDTTNAAVALLANLGGSAYGDGAHHGEVEGRGREEMDRVRAANLTGPGGMERFATGNMGQGLNAGRVGGGVVQSQYDMLTSMGAAPPSLAHMDHPDHPLFSHLNMTM